VRILREACQNSRKSRLDESNVRSSRSSSPPPTGAAILRGRSPDVLMPLPVRCRIVIFSIHQSSVGSSQARYQVTGTCKRIQLGIATVVLVAASLVGLAVLGTSAHNTAPLWIYPGHNTHYWDHRTPPPHSCWPPSCYDPTATPRNP
jgi:hypothetical protein